MDILKKMGEIEKRLRKVPPGPWVCHHFQDGLWVVRELKGMEFDTANFVAHSPEDIAFLLKELGKRIADAEQARFTGPSSSRDT